MGQTDVTKNFNPDNYRSVAAPNLNNIGSDISGTLSSMRDTFAVSFQTLNLTLGSMNSTLKNMGNFGSGVLPNNSAFSSAFPLSQTPMFAGNMSPVTQNIMASASPWQLAAMNRPFNANPWEFGTNRAQAMGHDFGNMALGAMGSAIDVGAFTYGGRAAAALAPGMFGGMMGSGMAGQLGMRALGSSMLMGFPVSMAASAIAQPFMQEAGNVLHDTNLFRTMGRMQSPTGFSGSQSNNLARGIRQLSHQELFSNTQDPLFGTDGYREFMTQGMQSGLIRGENTADLIKQAGEGARAVKLIAGLLGSQDMKEAIQALTQLKNMGIDPAKGGAGQIANIAFQATGYSSMAGMSPSQMLNNAVNGSSHMTQFGMAPIMGVAPHMQNTAIANELFKRGRLSPAEMAVSGGATGIANNMNTWYGGMASNGSFGGLMTGMGMTSSGFSLDQFNSAGSKGMSYFDQVGASAANVLSSPWKMAAHWTNQTDAMSQLDKNGQFNSRIIEQARKALENMPFAFDPSKSLAEQRTMAAAHLKSIGGSLGLPTDDATIKVIADQVVNNKLGYNPYDNRANQGMAMNQYYSDNDSYSPFSNFGRRGAQISRFGSRIYRGIVEGPGAGLAGVLDRAFSPMDVGDQFGQGALTTRQIMNGIEIDGGSLPSMGGGLSDREKQAGYRHVALGMGIGRRDGSSALGPIINPRETIESIQDVFTNRATGYAAFMNRQRFRGIADTGTDKAYEGMLTKGLVGLPSNVLDGYMGAALNSAGESFEGAAEQTFNMRKTLFKGGSEAYVDYVRSNIYDTSGGRTSASFLANGGYNKIIGMLGMQDPKSFTSAAFDAEMSDPTKKKSIMEAAGIKTDEDYFKLRAQTVAMFEGNSGGLTSMNSLNVMGGDLAAGREFQANMRLKYPDMINAASEMAMKNEVNIFNGASASLKGLGITPEAIEKMLEAGPVSNEDIAAFQSLHEVIASDNKDQVKMAEALKRIKNPVLREIAKGNMKDISATTRAQDSLWREAGAGASIGDALQGGVSSIVTGAIRKNADILLPGKGEKLTELAKKGDIKGLMDLVSGDTSHGADMLRGLGKYAELDNTKREEILRSAGELDEQSSAGDISKALGGYTDEKLRQMAIISPMENGAVDRIDYLKEAARQGKDIADVIEEGTGGSYLRVMQIKEDNKPLPETKEQRELMRIREEQLKTEQAKQISIPGANQTPQQSTWLQRIGMGSGSGVGQVGFGSGAITY